MYNKFVLLLIIIITWVYNPNNTFAENCNIEMVDLDPLSPKDEEQIIALLHKHIHLTGSKVAQALLNNWAVASGQFVKVYPKEYKKVIEKLQYQTIS